jgi:hypothetical protein
MSATLDGPNPGSRVKAGSAKIPAPTVVPATSAVAESCTHAMYTDGRKRREYALDFHAVHVAVPLYVVAAYFAP